MGEGCWTPPSPRGHTVHRLRDPGLEQAGGKLEAFKQAMVQVNSCESQPPCSGKCGEYGFEKHRGGRIT